MLSNSQLALLIVLFVFSSIAATSRVEVTIENGPIIGEVIRDKADNRPVNRFLGIPYAQPPVGSLRFRKPVPLVAKWQQPVEALHWPSSCVQLSDHAFFKVTESMMLNRNMSEDCLYLNVWSPNVEVTQEDELRPVLVWIHGGALTSGTSAFDLYDGETLANRAYAVVVSFNYRLATLGFLYSNQVSDIPGNQALWDQALVLEWVQDNIRYFGGNPKRVTIMGESAGGWFVSLLILSPITRNLFYNAIVQSGAAINDKALLQPEQYVSQFLTGIRKIGCASEDDLTIDAKVVQCLEELDAEKVDLLYYLIDRNPLDFQTLIVIDGHFLPNNSLTMLSEGNYKTNVNLLASTVQDEGSFLFALIHPNFQGPSPKPLPLDKARHFLIDHTSNNYLHKPVPEELINKVYFSRFNPSLASQDEFRKQVGIAFGDLFLGCPTIEFAKQVYQHSKAQARVFQLYYSAKLGTDKVLCPKWAGTCHLNDLYSVFGMPLRYPNEYTSREKDISREMIHIIGDFITNGKPGPEHSEWLSYFESESSENSGEIIAPYYEIGNHYREAESFKFNLKKLECNSIWNKFN